MITVDLGVASTRVIFRDRRVSHDHGKFEGLNEIRGAEREGEMTGGTASGLTLR
jgi:hypothetical protein